MAAPAHRIDCQSLPLFVQSWNVVLNDLAEASRRVGEVELELFAKKNSFTNTGTLQDLCSRVVYFNPVQDPGPLPEAVTNFCDDWRQEWVRLVERWDNLVEREQQQKRIVADGSLQVVIATLRTLFDHPDINDNFFDNEAEPVRRQLSAEESVCLKMVSKIKKKAQIKRSITLPHIFIHRSRQSFADFSSARSKDLLFRKIHEISSTSAA